MSVMIAPDFGKAAFLIERIRRHVGRHTQDRQAVRTIFLRPERRLAHHPVGNALTALVFQHLDRMDHAHAVMDGGKGHTRRLFIPA